MLNILFRSTSLSRHLKWSTPQLTAQAITVRTVLPANGPTSQQNLSGFVGSDPPNLDPDEVWAPEHGEFTDPFIRDTSGQSRSGFVGSDPPDLDPDVP